jgi:hypothetical protein
MGVGGVPPQHAIPHPTLEQPSDVYVTDDGVTQEIFQGSGALPGVVDPAVVPDVDADAVNAPPAPAFQLPDLSTLFPPAPAG